MKVQTKTDILYKDVGVGAGGKGELNNLPLTCRAHLWVHYTDSDIFPVPFTPHVGFEECKGAFPLIVQFGSVGVCACPVGIYHRGVLWLTMRWAPQADDWQTIVTLGLPYRLGQRSRICHTSFCFEEIISVHVRTSLCCFYTEFIRTELNCTALWKSSLRWLEISNE